MSLLPLSPDITPLDIFHCGYVKDQAFNMNIDSADNFCAQISSAVASVTPQMLENV
jgi:hypothetical protein